MIKNITKNKILSNHKKFYKTLFSKAIGLMFSKKITDTGYVFIFKNSRRIDLHMFFVFYTIDVLFLDDNKKIIEFKKGFKPFSFYFSKRKAKYVVELPVETILRTKTSLGDIIDF